MLPGSSRWPLRRALSQVSAPGSRAPRRQQLGDPPQTVDLNVPGNVLERRHRRAGSSAGVDAGRRVLDDEAVLGAYAEPFGGEQVARRIRLACRDVVSGDQDARRRFGERSRGFGVSAPGTIGDGYLLDAVSLGWQAVDLRRIWLDAKVTVIGDDANLAAVAESRRGASRGSALALHPHTDFGLGGVVIAEGRVPAGVHETAGEFGHMPFGDPALLCPCGARGCWGLTADGGEMARLLGVPPPGEPVTFARAVIARAAQGSRPDVEAVDRVAANLGRGMAGLVNAFDPDIVTLSGPAAPVFDASPEPLLAAYDAGLMSVRREAAPPIVPSAIGEAGPLVGAGEQVWDGLWPTL